MNSSSSPVWKALHEAFPCTIPIFAGFWFLGIAYGIYANAFVYCKRNGVLYAPCATCIQIKNKRSAF